jgi:formate hydrogenlyase subunit 6/NADH:ubiquinone oxidoreductase subunit I
MKWTIPEQLDRWLEGLSAAYEVRVPTRQSDGTRALTRLGEGPLALGGGGVPGKPTGVFFPQWDVQLTYAEGRVQGPAPLEQPLLVVGFTACDVAGLAALDEFFSADCRDELYYRRREGAAIVVVSGRCGPEGEFQKIAGGDCDLELIRDGERYLAVAYTDTGRALEQRLEGETAAEADRAALQAESDALDREFAELIQRASELLRAGAVPDEFWKGIAERCISCTACNLVCPTCSCFEVFDRTEASGVVRYRCWDSCQLDGFTREASQHNPRGEQWQRTRRRIHHKLAADPERWGRITCVLCGRCDEACPTGIGIRAVCRALVGAYGA